MAYPCSKCNQVDQVQKVSAIVRSGTHTKTYDEPTKVEVGGNAVYGTVRQTRIEKTALAQTLTPPTDKDWQNWKESLARQSPDFGLQFDRMNPPPGKDQTEGFRTILVLVSLVLLVVGLLCLWIQQIQLGIILLVIFAIGIGANQLIFQVNSPEYKKWLNDRNAYVSVKEKEYKPIAAVQKNLDDLNATSIQQKAVQRYDELYYCHRDDLVFHPSTGFSASAADMERMPAWVKLGS